MRPQSKQTTRGRRYFLVTLLVFLSAAPGGCISDFQSTLEGEDVEDGPPAAPDVEPSGDVDPPADAGFRMPTPPTTLSETLAPLTPAGPRPKKDRALWGTTEIGPGEPFVPRNDLGAGDTVAEDPSSLGYFWHVTDVHISDEESPARLILGDDVVTTAYRYQEAWSTQLFEATIRTGNALSRTVPFDFVLITGDLVENIHRNELDWFLTIMAGGEVDPDSGDDEDPLPDSDLDPHSPFIAEGLDPSLPWYVTVGNHDEMIMGFSNDNLGGTIANPAGGMASLLSVAIEPTCLAEPWHETAPLEPDRCYMPPKSYFSDRNLVRDPNRKFVRGSDFLEPFFSTETRPDGHGFTKANIDNETSYYTVNGVLPGVPSVLIALDTIAHILDGGHIDDAQLAWLEAELDKAEAAGQLVIIASHHPSRSIERNHDEFIAALKSHPNVILHLAGHTHTNRIVPRPASNGMPASRGYWEVETASVIDWPQQTRIVEIVDNRDGTGDIYCTMLDFQVPEDLPSVAGGRFYSLYDVQDGNGETGTSGEAEDRNVILRFAWPDDIATTLESLPTRAVRSTGLEL
jgi:3',5'-cyclic AMP phosphodiesterase CpdA